MSGHQEEDVERAVAESLPKHLIGAHPVQGSQADEGSGGTCSPATMCAQRYGTEKPKVRLRCGLSEAKEARKTDGELSVLCPVTGRERASGGIEESKIRRDVETVSMFYHR